MLKDKGNAYNDVERNRKKKSSWYWWKNYLYAFDWIKWSKNDNRMLSD